MFPELPPFQADVAFLQAIGRSGGVCDCGDELDTPSSLSGIAAGWPKRTIRDRDDEADKKIVAEAATGAEAPPVAPRIAT